MKLSYKMLLKQFKKIGVATAILLSTQALYAAEEPRVAISGDFLRELRILMVIFGIIALLIAYIAIVLSVKDIQKFTLKYVWDDIVGRNDMAPEMHHEYDGIRELDNKMPSWLRILFLGTIVFAVAYLLHYQVFKTGALSQEEYEFEIATAAETYKSVELPEDQLVIVSDPGRLAKAGQVFETNCATCHRKDLGGESGPNLTDKYWLHGSTVKDLYNTITNGVDGKSMISWKEQIPSTERLAIASYILSKQGSNPVNPRPQEGVEAGAEVIVQPDSTAQDSGLQAPASPQ